MRALRFRGLLLAKDEENRLYYLVEGATQDGPFCQR